MGGGFLAVFHGGFIVSAGDHGRVAKPVAFDFEDMEITAGDDVAFATAIGHCVNIEHNGEKTNLKFRLTMGFHKQDGRWRIVHEHHSLPAID